VDFVVCTLAVNKKKKKKKKSGQVSTCRIGPFPVSSIVRSRYRTTEEQIQPFCVGFVVLTSVAVKASLFWDITSCNPMKFNKVSGENIAFIFRVKNKSSIK
jgi:hypothetical protein